jgi:hypothetical protein
MCAPPVPAPVNGSRTARPTCCRRTVLSARSRDRSHSAVLAAATARGSRRIAGSAVAAMVFAPWAVLGGLRRRGGSQLGQVGPEGGWRGCCCSAAGAPSALAHDLEAVSVATDGGDIHRVERAHLGGEVCD